MTSQLYYHPLKPLVKNYKMVVKALMIFIINELITPQIYLATSKYSLPTKWMFDI